jgi:predicted ATPase
LSRRQLFELDFEPITILYGGNGSGKTTALNIIAEKLGLVRDTLYNRTNFFETYTKLCSYHLACSIPKESRMITSDDVFDYMLNLRSINNGIDQKRDDLFQECLESKYSNFQMRSLDDYDQLKKVNLARRKSQSQYVRKQLMNNIREQSNGESAFRYFSEKINDNGLYLLDEPENSLSPQRQQDLLALIEDFTRFFGCQFIIATHSPFLLAMKTAKIYDLDDSPTKVKKWTELSNVRLYYDFFKQHECEFL